jgi:hypothetical protein
MVQLDAKAAKKQQPGGAGSRNGETRAKDD